MTRQLCGIERTALCLLQTGIVLGTVISPVRAFPPPLACINWTQLSPTTSPSMRSGHAMAYDSTRGVTVLFGGVDDNNTTLADTWEWNGTNWTQRSPATSPPDRRFHAMAFDSARGVTVLFGGSANGSAIGGTWEWNGTNWSQRSPTTNPSARNQHAMAYDSARGVVVMFGGWDSMAIILNETWEWNGTDWTLRAPMASPPGRIGSAMAYDTARGVSVLFGGGDTGGNFNDVWEWNGTTWTHPTPATNPSTRNGHAMAYDATRGVTTLFSGNNGVNDTWDWNGTDWIEQSPAISPAALFYHALAYDDARGVIVLFGGNSSTLVNDTWTLSGLPPTSAGVDSPSYCLSAKPTNIMLTATGGSGQTLGWYSGSCGGTSVGTGTPLTISAPAATTAYFARWETPNCGNSTCASVTVTVNADPVAPISASVSPSSFCSDAAPTNVSLTATGGSGDSLHWYTGSCGGTAVGTGSPLVIAPPGATTTYFARWETASCGNSTCASTTVTVADSPTCAITAEAVATPGSVGVIASAAAGADGYSWSLTDGVITAGQGTNSITFTAPSGVESFDINLTVTDSVNCSGTCSKTVSLESASGSQTTCGASSGTCGAGTGTLLLMAIPLLRQVRTRRHRCSDSESAGPPPHASKK